MKKALFWKMVGSERRVTGVVAWSEISIVCSKCVDVRSVRVGDDTAGWDSVTELELRMSAVWNRRCVCLFACEW
jgi:hypothetical protein